MKILLTAILILAASAIAVDDKNVGVGMASFAVARGAGCLIENEWEDAGAVEIATINVACFAVAGCAGVFVETLQTGDTHAEIKSDTNARIKGAALACGVTVAAQLFYRYVIDGE